MIFILLAMLSIQFGASVAKNLFGFFQPEVLSFYRIFFAFILMTFGFRIWKSSFRNLPWLRILPYGISLGIMNLTFYLSLQKIHLGLAVAIEFVGPLLYSSLLSRKKLDFLWIGMAALGLSFLLPELSHLFQKDLNQTESWGVVWAFVAGLFWASYIHFGSKMSQNISPQLGSYLGMGIAALSVLPFALTKVRFESLNLKNMGFLLSVALLSSAIPYTLELFAMKKIPPKVFGLLMSLEPVIASLAGWIVLHESLSLTQTIAIALIISASWGVTYFSERVY